MKLIEDHILKHFGDSLEEGKDFREKYLYTCEVNDVLINAENLIKRVFNFYCHPNKKWLTLKEGLDLLQRQAQIKITDLAIT